MSQFLEAFLREHLPLGDILEIGYSPNRSKTIAKLQPKSHLIIEKEHVNEAKKLANVLVGSWREVLEKLSSKFDLIFYDEEEAFETVEHKVMKRANLLLNEGKALLNKIEMTFPQMKTLKYSQREIDLLLEKTCPEKLAPFLSNLMEQGQITKDLYQAFLKKHGLEKPTSKSRSDLYSIVDECLKNHLRANGQFFCLSSSTVSKYENAKFFENIITNPDYDYLEELLSEGFAIQIKKNNF